MYTLSVKRDFVAYHFLVGGDWGPENQKHSHNYRVEVRLEGASLDEHGYLVDIVHVEKHLDEIIAGCRSKTLNELVEFENLNPSIENFCRILCQALIKRIAFPNISAVTVKVDENEIASASYRQEL
jgi:6-pyruvoyltetrahydropterin/6-carboxytetrahydropterin synthase